MNEDALGLITRWPLIEKFGLPPGANVAVVGAYKGLAMEALANLYPDYGRIIGFEPQDWAMVEATQRMAHYRDTKVYGFGLGTSTRTMPMGEWHTDACSFINVGPGSRQQGSGALMDALAFLGSDPDLEHIHLMIMNIEGYEYQLIPYLRSGGVLKNIDRLAIQWHLGLGSEPKDKLDMDAEIERLIHEDGFSLVVDERPAWTYLQPAWALGDS